MLLVLVILFAFAVFVSFYIPGFIFLSLIRMKLTTLERTILSFPIGSSIFLLVSYFLAWSSATFLLYIVLFIFFVIFFFNSFKSSPHKKKYRANNIRAFFQSHFSLTLIAIILCGIFAFTSATFSSGLMTQKGMQFFGVNSVDGITHLAFIKIQTHFFPPQHPGLSGVPIRGYHYFYDFLLSRFIILYHFSAEDLLFRFFPLYISLLYGLSFFLFSKLLTNDKKTQLLVVFFSYFAQNMFFLFSLFSRQIDITSDIGLVQPINLMYDPSIVFSTSILLCGLYFLLKSKNSWQYAFSAGLLLGILSQTKVYTGIIGISSLLTYAFYALLKKDIKHFKKILLSIITAAGLTVLTYFANNFGAGNLVYAPLLIYEQYMNQPIFASMHWQLKRLVYTQHHNTPRLIQLYLEAFFLLWTLNLSLRLVSLLALKDIRNKKFWNGSTILIATMLIIPLLIPSFFIQSISVFDIMQFIWIELALLSIPSALVFGKILQKLSTLFQILLVLGILILTLPKDLYVVAQNIVPGSRAIISAADIALYQRIQQRIPPTGTIVVLPNKNLHTKMFDLTWSLAPDISAMTGRRVYYEGEVISYPVDTLYSMRKQELRKLYQEVVKCDKQGIVQHLKRMGSAYLLSLFTNKCLNTLHLPNSYQTGDVGFYEFN